jgi:hypothetical protein
MLGGLGALTPILINFLALDHEVVFSHLKPFAVLGYALRVVILFYLGGVVAFLHKNEKSELRFFELGIIAPAILIAMINAGQANPKNALPSPPTGIVFDLFPTAYAQADEKKVKDFSPPSETLGEQFWRGLTGARSARLWFVIAGSHLKIEDAEKQAQRINDGYGNFHAEVYDRYRENPYYAVVIGYNLSYKEAASLKQKAVEAGLPRDTYLWKYPDN